MSNYNPYGPGAEVQCCMCNLKEVVNNLNFFCVLISKKGPILFKKKKLSKTEIINILSGENSEKFYKYTKEAINNRKNLLEIMAG